ncbi:TetR family transcriptional regulator [Allonocardiopsis opalescens]|nr:TetR family transcriptional regulator [Allonocardiopsis opalescens]
MPTRDPEAKRRRLLDAARAEFAAHGIAGARVDRIAKRAGCSAGLVYTYFGGKDELFDAVFADVVDGAVTEVPITPDDIPGYAGRLFDAHERHPEVARVVGWYRLERGTALPSSAGAATGAKVAAVRAAQEAGTVSRRFDAEQLIALVLTLSAMWTAASVEAGSDAADRAVRRATVVDAVRRLVEP